ncbi:hypothetical protein CRG98_020178 [Punica granatum]|uniref:Uncharacterized protein n=1 Tax=Punica granatum TaxID=22663 RepID=A0A2I0JSX4_PUNGR|nr:hypothetical protein CRG98_020178 [Punica granatum]
MEMHQRSIRESTGASSLEITNREAPDASMETHQKSIREATGACSLDIASRKATDASMEKHQKYMGDKQLQNAREVETVDEEKQKDAGGQVHSQLSFKPEGRIEKTGRKTRDSRRQAERYGEEKQRDSAKRNRKMKGVEFN